ncbi:uncharacterized protein LOC141655332 [Silene latifolia]|uniref:uncharacterized protein LOC141655332 n=1 Tax=Silene latifolia TaxID=37657 RepID=UPI003D789910
MRFVALLLGQGPGFVYGPEWVFPLDSVWDESLILDPLNDQLIQNERACAQGVIELRKARTQFLSQKAKCEWSKMGDENTSYFHARIKRRRARNRVFQVREVNRRVVASGNCISEEHCSLLLAPISTEEVKQAMFDIPGDKAPGPDGYSSHFFKENWAIVGTDIVAAVRGAFSSGKLLKQKAYDSVEWSFVRDMLMCLGFPERFLRLVMECVMTPTYTLSLNGDNFGFFPGMRGLRQGDPLSPLLFTICLEYFSCVVGVIQRHARFKFHPLCNRIQLTHLCFADDLILFCRGDRDSSELLLRAFNHFSKSSGLIMNKGKSNFYCNGVDDSVILHLENKFGMRRGIVPFKYLGVNVTPKRLSILDCDCLVEKIVEKIRGFGARKLSYAGRMVLIKAVLSNIHSYWARIFILPKTVIKKIEGLCRNYLWHGTDNKETPALVSWDQICHKKKHGGLGLRDLHVWNVAAIGKYVWWVAMKADHLWVRWVHAIYIKSQSWADYQPAIGSSWAWKKICQVKNIYKAKLFSTNNVEHYSIKEGYDWLRPEGPIVSWYPWMLNRWILPKHSFMVWLVAQQRLLTQDRLIKMNITTVNCCFLCGDAEESHSHLFFYCYYSRCCLQLISDWYFLQLPITECIHWWVKWRTPELSRKKIIAMIIASILAHVWFSRNKCRIEGYVIRPTVLCRMIKMEVQNRLNNCVIKSHNRRVIDWVHYLQSA